MQTTLALSANRRASFVEVWYELYRYRVLVSTLVARQVQARYRGSILGFLWTVLNPLLMMSVYLLVFSYYMRIDVPNYGVFLLCGLLPWSYFASALTEGTNSVLSGGGLITKSLFPPHILPTVALFSQLANYLFSLPVLIVAIFFYGMPLHASLLFLPVVLLVQTAFTWGLVLALSALNVHFRDTQHILEKVLLLWFFLSPVIYPAGNIPEGLRFTHWLNPMGLLIESHHLVVLDGQLPSLEVFLATVGYALAAALAGNAIFEYYRETFPELV